MARVQRVRWEIHGDQVKVIAYKAAARGRLTRSGTIVLERDKAGKVVLSGREAAELGLPKARPERS